MIVGCFFSIIFISMIKAILVDDEPSALSSMRWELQNFCPDIQVIEAFTNPEDAISAINYLKPDCVFLDIEMPQMDGFTLLEQLSFRRFALVITTAYESYALKAFKENALDYLMKPIDSDDLMKCVKKIKEQLKVGPSNLDIDSLLKLLPSEPHKKKVALHLNGKIIYQDLELITHCEAAGNYTTLFLIDGQRIVVSKKIKEMEAQLEPNKFIRVHQSYLVNPTFIKEFIRSEGQYLMLANNINIPVSRAKRAEVLELLERL